jgi:hypothetical protein
MMNDAGMDTEITRTLEAVADSITSSQTTDPVPGVAARSDSRMRRRHAVMAIGAVASVAVFALGSFAFGAVMGGSGADTQNAGPLGGGTSTSVSISSSPTASPTWPPLPPQELALAQQLSTNRHVEAFAMLGKVPSSWVVLCGLSVRGSSPNGKTVYAQVSCGGYTTGSHAARMRAGGSAAVLHIVGSGGATRLLSVDFPRQQHYASDVQRMFPASVKPQIFALRPVLRPTSDELLAIAKAS